MLRSAIRDVLDSADIRATLKACPAQHCACVCHHTTQLSIEDALRVMEEERLRPATAPAAIQALLITAPRITAAKALDAVAAPKVPVARAADTTPATVKSEPAPPEPAVLEHTAAKAPVIKAESVPAPSPVPRRPVPPLRKEHMVKAEHVVKAPQPATARAPSPSPSSVSDVSSVHTSDLSLTSEDEAAPADAPVPST